jgi:1-acyl-sn-glycerol-3-phosphate acyltransferase
VATIIAANHSSALDLFATGHALRRPGHFVAKSELFEIPVFGWFLRSLGAIPARRDRRDTDVLRQLLAILQAGGLMGLAPEGTRSPDGCIGRYDPGFAWLASRTGARVVPCAIHGAHELMPKGARWPRHGSIWLRFGAPESFPSNAGTPSRQDLQAFADSVRDRTVAMVNDLARESGVPRRAAREEI